MRRSAVLLLGLFAVSASALLLAPGCGGSNAEPSGGGDGNEGGADIDTGTGPGPGEEAGPGPGEDGGGGDSGQCTGLCRQQLPCPNGGDTVITGTVYDPMGKVPLPNVMVYVPNAPLGPVGDGASCAKCSYSGSPLTSAVTDAAGHFSLPHMPLGAGIPVVTQLGKWRREVPVDMLPNSAGQSPHCATTAPTPPGGFRLPRNRAEGNIPLMALSTGGGDSLECFMRRVGIEDTEFGIKGGPQRIHLYKGEDQETDAGNGLRARSQFEAGSVPFPLSTSLWSSLDTLKPYDTVILSCEGSANASTKPPTAVKALYDYQSLGGRVFATHQHQYWFSHGAAANLGAWLPNPVSGGAAPQNADINKSFDDGVHFASWAQNAKVLTTSGQVPVSFARQDLQAVRGSARAWATIPDFATSRGGPAVQLMSFDAPIPATAGAPTCGRAVFADFHVSDNSSVDATGEGEPFPTGCDLGELKAHEKALEYMLLVAPACL